MNTQEVTNLIFGFSDALDGLLVRLTESINNELGFDQVCKTHEWIELALYFDGVSCQGSTQLVVRYYLKSDGCDKPKYWKSIHPLLNRANWFKKEFCEYLIDSIKCLIFNAKKTIDVDSVDKKDRD